MTLQELKERIKEIEEHAKELGYSPDEFPVHNTSHVEPELEIVWQSSEYYYLNIEFN